MPRWGEDFRENPDPDLAGSDISEKYKSLKGHISCPKSHNTGIFSQSQVASLSSVAYALVVFQFWVFMDMKDFLSGQNSTG
jgi:hypothetical protein